MKTIYYTNDLNENGPYKIFHFDEGDIELYTEDAWKLINSLSPLGLNFKERN